MNRRLVRSNSRSGCSNSISNHTKISSIMPNSLQAISNSKRWLHSLLNDTVKLNLTPIAIGAVQIFSRKCKLYLFFAPPSYLNDMIYLCRVEPKQAYTRQKQDGNNLLRLFWPKNKTQTPEYRHRENSVAVSTALNISLHTNRNSCVKVTKASRRNHLRVETS